MDTLKTCYFSKTHSVQISAYSNAWTEWIGPSDLKQNKTKKNTWFQGSHFVCAGEGRVVVMVVCGGLVCGCVMTFVWKSLGVGKGVLGGWYVFRVCVGGWLSFGQVA